MAYNVQEQLRPQSLLRDALEPLKPAYVVSVPLPLNGYLTRFVIQFEDGDRVELEDWHVRALIDTMDRDRMAAMMSGVIPRDISSEDFTNLHLLGYINAHKDIQNNRCAS